MSTTIQTHKIQHNKTREIVKYIISAVLVGLGIAVFLILKGMAPVPESRIPTALIQQVTTVPAESYGGMLFREVSGTVVPHREVRVAAEVAGRITKRYPACDNGNFVTEGELLLEIDPESYLIEISTLKAEIRQAEKRIEENRRQIAGEQRNIELAQTDLRLQTNELERSRRAGRALSQAELEVSQRAVNSAETQLAARETNLSLLEASELRLEAALDLAKLQLERAELNLRRTQITAPSDGIIVRALVQEGDYVNSGTQLILFEDISRAEVLSNLTPAELRWLRQNGAANAELIDNGQRSVYRIPKTEVTIFDPADPTTVWRGVLSRFDGIGRDDVTKTIPVRILVEEPIVESPTGTHALVRGMYVRSRMEVFVSASEGNYILIPEVAIHPNGYIWTVENNELAQVSIETVNRIDWDVDGKPEKFAVVKPKSGSLSPGTAVVVSPINQPVSGMRVLLPGQNAEDIVLGE